MSYWWDMFSWGYATGVQECAEEEDSEEFEIYIELTGDTEDE